MNLKAKLFLTLSSSRPKEAETHKKTAKTKTREFTQDGNQQADVETPEP